MVYAAARTKKPRPASMESCDVHSRSWSRQSGFNLIEVLVAALILSVGLLSMAGLQVASLKSVQNATQKQQASFIVHELLERMRSNRTAALAGNYNSTGGTFCSSLSSGMDCSGSTNCSPLQIAVYDLYTLQCGNGSNSAKYAGANGKLINSQFDISCPAGCDNGVRVEMSWEERLTREGDSTGSAAGATTQVFNLSVDAVI